MHSGEQDHFQVFAGISPAGGASHMEQCHPAAEEKFWSQSVELWKRSCLGPSEVSQGNSSTHIEYLSHPHHKASHGREWGACGETRPRPAANLVMHNRFELLAEEPEGNTDDLPTDLSQVETQGLRSFGCEAAQFEPSKAQKAKPAQEYKSQKQA